MSADDVLIAIGREVCAELACPESWPAKRGCSAWGADYGFHGCKFDPDHDGPHRCLCGRAKPASLGMTEGYPSVTTDHA